MKIISLNKEEFEKFANNHPLKSYYQSTSYGDLMSNFGFKSSYLGFYENNTLVGATMILSRSIYLGFKYGYAPHGILIDYTNKQLISQTIKKLKSYLLKDAFLILKIDPLIIRTIRDKEGKVLQKNEQFNTILETLKQTGLLHCGFNNYLESVKPRWHAMLNMQGKNITELFYDLEKQVRNKLRKAVKYGVEIYKDNTSSVETVYPFIKEKGNYSQKYYQEMQQSFGDNFEVYLARLNTETYVANSKNLFEKETEVNDYLNNVIQEEGYRGKDMRSILNKKMESDRILASYKKHLVNSTNLLKKYPDGLIIGGAIVIKQGTTINLLIEGYAQEYSNLCPGYLTKWKIIEKYAQTGITTFDLNAISGNFTDKNPFKGLNEAKFGYNCLGYEYIGEFNLIVNKPVYAIYRNTSDKYNIKNQLK